MNSTNIVSRLARKASRATHNLLGVDSITRRSVRSPYRLQRFGSRYGGWYIPEGMLNEESICYCVGCGEDITFDLALIESFGCKVYGFDPTPRAVEHVARVTQGNDSYCFAPVGLWNENTVLKFFEPKDPTHVSHSALNLQKTQAYFAARVQRLATIMQAHGHTKLDLLKLDIEGAEYAVLDSILADGIVVGILCVEFDEYFQPLDSDYRSRIARSIDKLYEAGFRIAHTAGNGNYTFVRANR